MKKVPDEKCIAICGLFCGACPAFPEECNGCLSDFVREGCKECKKYGFRDCAKEHNVKTYVAVLGDNSDSIEVRYEDENIWLTQKMLQQFA